MGVFGLLGFNGFHLDFIGFHCFSDFAPSSVFLWTHFLPYKEYPRVLLDVA